MPATRDQEVVLSPWTDAPHGGRNVKSTPFVEYNNNAERRLTNKTYDLSKRNDPQEESRMIRPLYKSTVATVAAAAGAITSTTGKV